MLAGINLREQNSCFKFWDFFNTTKFFYNNFVCDKWLLQRMTIIDKFDYKTHRLTQWGIG